MGHERAPRAPAHLERNCLEGRTGVGVGVRVHVEQPVSKRDVKKGAKTKLTAVNDDDGKVDAGGNGAVSAEIIMRTDFDF